VRQVILPSVKFTFLHIELKNRVNRRDDTTFLRYGVLTTLCFVILFSTYRKKLCIIKRRKVLTPTYLLSFYRALFGNVKSSAEIQSNN